MPRQPTLLPPAPPHAVEPMPAEAVLAAVAPVQQALIALLLHSGVDYPQLAAALKPWFLEQARAGLQRSGRAVTDSALSLHSGVHRKDVRSWRQNALAEKRQRDIALTAQVYARWSSDADYRDRRRRPRALPRTGAAPSFESLVHSVTQDVRPFTMLQELIRLGLASVEIRRGQEVVVPHAAGFVPAPGSLEALELLGANLGDHAQAAVSNVLGEAARLEQSVFAAGINAAAAEELSVLARRLWAHARAELIAEATRLYEAGRGQPDATHRVRFGSYFWTEETAPPAAPPPADEEPHP